MKKEKGFTDAQLIRLVMAIKGTNKAQTIQELGISRQTLYAWLNNKQKIAEYRKPVLEGIVYEFIQEHKRFKPIAR